MKTILFLLLSLSSFLSFGQTYEAHLDAARKYISEGKAEDAIIQ